MRCVVISLLETLNISHLQPWAYAVRSLPLIESIWLRIQSYYSSLRETGLLFKTEIGETFVIPRNKCLCLM